MKNDCVSVTFTSFKRISSSRYLTQTFLPILNQVFPLYFPVGSVFGRSFLRACPLRPSTHETIRTQSTPIFTSTHLSVIGPVPPGVPSGRPKIRLFPELVKRLNISNKPKPYLYLCTLHVDLASSFESSGHPNRQDCGVLTRTSTCRVRLESW